ncbi:MAG: glycerate kinase [Spirochaetales bacterium]|jgi:hydroxypyruvate reductase|nr:glycerate kinase [Spirochaetales bacterium]
MSADVRKDLAAIFDASVRRVDPYMMLKDRMSVSGDTLSVKTDGETLTWDLSRYARILVLGAGKATAKMALAVEEVLAGRISEGVIAVKAGHTESLKKIRMICAGHPVPDAGSVEAGRTIAELCRGADERTLILNLISGGGSALLSFPYAWKDDEGEHSLTLEDKQAATKALLACGANIQEINCIRKHLSGIKGGRLAQLSQPADCVNLILSDVVGDRLDSIASGLAVPDNTSYAEAMRLIKKFDIAAKLPALALRVLQLGEAGKLPETPKKGDPVFSKVKNILIGSNYGALLAAERTARELGYNTIVLSSEITGEAREAARFYIGIARDAAKHELAVKKPACVIAGGETTVTLRGSGKGGRNQEMALSFLSEIEANPEGSTGIWFLAASTDGNDGPTDAAGAFADLDVLAAGKKAGLSLQEYLAANDSYHFFDKIGFLCKTGPTNTNVCDVQLTIIK